MSTCGALVVVVDAVILLSCNTTAKTSVDEKRDSPVFQEDYAGSAS